MKKIAIIPPVPLTKTELERRRKQYKLFASLETEVEIRLLPGGPPLTDSEYDQLWATGYMVAEAERAEEGGADAVVIDCTSDPGIVEMQQSLNIPVIGSLKASIMTALQIGRTFSVLALDEIWAGMIHRKVEQYKLGNHLSSVEIVGTYVYNPDRGRDMNDDEFNSFLIELFKAAEKAVEGGADSVILGSTTVINGWKELERHLQVPVIAPGIAALKTAEMILSLGLQTSRKAYPEVTRRWMM